MGGRLSLPLSLPRTKSLEGTGLEEGAKKGKKRDTFSFFFSKTELCGGGGRKEGRERRKGGGEGLESTKCIALFKVILREGERRDLDYFLALNGYQ